MSCFLPSGLVCLFACLPPFFLRSFLALDLDQEFGNKKIERGNKEKTWKKLKKQEATHEPECSHVEHFCETSYLNSLVHFSPGTVPVHCRLWKVEGCGVQSAGCEESGVLSGECKCIV